MLKGNKRILKNFKQKKKAFTLLEIVVALGIVAIMIMTLGGALVTSVKANKMGEIKQESKLISQEIIEKLRSIGDVKDTVLNVGNNQGDTVEILENPAGGFDVKGTLTDSSGTTMVKGIITKSGDLKENHGSLNYLAKEFGLFIFIESDETGTNPNNNKITYWDPSNGAVTTKNIDGYLDKIVNADKVKNNCNELKIEVGEGSNKNRLKVNGEYLNDLPVLGGTNPLGRIGIYVKNQRDNLGKINLYLDNKNKSTSDKLEVYFFNNKFHGLDYVVGAPVTDSFKEDRYINGSIDIFDNIIYSPKSERLNKGLYTIELEFNKKVPNGSTVTEKTRSEFMVDN